MSAAGERPRIISPGLVMGLALVSALSLIAYFAISAYAPDLRNESNGDAHALSKSAIGFAGLRVLLEADGIASTIDRGLGPQDERPASIVVLTPEITTASSGLKALCKGRPCLIVLPKWIPVEDPARPGLAVRVGAFDEKTVAAVLKDISKGTNIRQSKGIASVPFAVKENLPGFVLPERGPALDTLQTISGADWISIVATGNGSVVLGQMRGTQTYVLSEPDLMNTHGLADVRTAAMALAFFRVLRAGDGPVVFDVTLNGFGRTPSVLKAMFAPPFLGATICAIIAALLIAFHAFTRFGAQPPPAPGFALGKRTLVDNTAALIRVMHREPRMAERYAAATRNLILRALGVRRQMDRAQVDAVLQVLERRAGDVGIEALTAEAAQVRRNSELMRVAGQLFRWRERIVHAR